MTRWLTAVTLIGALALASCSDETPPEQANGKAADNGETITNRIDIPPKVIQNLGITFAEVEKLRIEQTLRVPGRFESPPEARREYQTMLPGRVDLRVNQYDAVEVDDVLFALDSPQWRKMQEELAGMKARVGELRAERKVIVSEQSAAREALTLYPARFEALDDLAEASESHIKLLREARDHWQSRVVEIEDLIAKGAGKASELADARGEVKSAQSAISDELEKQAEIAEQRATLKAEQRQSDLSLTNFKARLESDDVKIANAERAFELQLSSAATALGTNAASLKRDDAWASMDVIVVRATVPGTVAHLNVSSGAWVEGAMPVIHTIDMTMVRFRAKALQADLGLLEDGQPARIVPPQGGSLAQAKTIEGTMRLPTEANGDERVLDILVIPDALQSWARPGVTAEAEIVWDATAEPKLAIPLRSVIQDGLEKLVFIRDPADSTKVIRATPSLGIDDGRWIVIETDVLKGYEVILDGAYELKLTGGGKAPEGGHFHADGTFHKGPDH